MKKIYLILLTVLCFGILQAQTTLISPTGDGGFENGTTFIASGWQLSNSVNNPWAIGGVNTTAPFSGRSAYPSLDNGVTSSYNVLNPCQNYFWRDVTVPAGETKIILTFNWIGQGESSWDIVQVFTAPTTATPVGAATHPGSGTSNVPTSIAGATFVINTAPGTTGVQTITVTLPASLAGTTFRLIFLWKSDTSTGTQPPVSVDNISLVSSVPSSITSTSIGGLWSSPATWVGGVVPFNDNATIADGSIVTVDQVVNVNNLSIGGGTSGILQWNATANAVNVSGNITVNAGANVNMFTAAASHPGVSINIGGNFTNNGTVHAAMAAAVVNFNSLTSSTPSNLDGSGTFVGGIIGQLVNASTGGVTINTTQNIMTRAIAHTAGALNTNGKLSLDNTATIFGASFNQRIYNIVVTGMGTGYNSATPPTITIAAPASGTTATATPNIDDATGTLRSITITNPGIGYASNPSVTISGGTGTGATAIAVNNRFSSGLGASSIQKSGAATITGGINIRSEQSVGALASSNALGAGYTSAPSVGFPLPFGYQNLVTSVGSGYTSLPTVTVSGGTFLTGVANPTFTVVVAQGRVVSVIGATGGSQWTSQPTLTITGGGGSGATAAYPANSLATATATISNGAISGYTVINGGSGYTAAPTPTLVGGGFTTVAIPFSAVALYNLTLNAFAPASTNAPHTETGLMPSNRRINILSVTNAVAGSAFTGDVEIYALAPLTLTASVLSFGSNTLFASHPSYAGLTGSATNNISGNIRLSTPGGSLTRTFPFDAPVFVATGTGSLATGSTITTLTASRTAAPSGTGNPVGTRAYNILANAGSLYGTNPTVTLAYNSNDGLISDQQSLFVGQSAALTGPWTTRSLTSGTGALPATGTRTTAITGVGPIVPTGNDFFAWTSTFVPPPALNYVITRTTANAYQSIAPVGSGGDGTGILSTASGDENTQIGINIAAAGFIYQGAAVTSMAIHPNGYIVLNNSYYPTYSSVSSWDNTLSPVNNGFAGSFDGNKRNVIAPFYDDLNKATPVIYYKISGTKVIAEWFNTTFFGLSGPQLYFQAVLDAADQSITFNYGNMQLYNGTQNIRYSYTSGISGSFIQPIPQPGQVMQQQYENTRFFTHENAGTSNWGANGLSISPEPRSSIKFTPGTYISIAVPAQTAPANDEPAGAILRPSLPGFPSNIAWDNGTNTSNLFTTRFATNTASPAVCGGASNAKDVWFRFIAPNPSVTVRIYGSGGFIPRISLYDAAINVLPNCVVGAQGLIANTAATGLTVGNTYYARVYHDNTGIQATATANVAGGIVTGLTVTSGTNYSNPATAFGSYSPQNQGPRITISGGGGNGAAAAWTTPTTTTSVLPLTASNLSVTSGSGYTSAPTVTIESPDWGISGEFGIVIFSLPDNDDCTGAIALTNINNTNCTTGQNSVTANTAGATASTEPAATSCGTPDDDLWYKFTAIATSTNINVQGTGSFDAAFELFNGGTAPGTCGTKTSVSCTDVTGPGALESIVATTVIGNTYFVRVYHAGVGTVTGETFNICVLSAPPACPIGLLPATGTSVDATVGATLSWTAAVSPPSAVTTGYDVYFDTNNPPTTLVSPNQAGTTYATGVLVLNTIYYWSIAPKNSQGTTTGCTISSINTNAPACPTTPVPAIASSTCPSNTATVLSWAASAGATGYDVYFNAGAGPATTLVSANQPSLSYSVGVLTAGQYAWKVNAKNNNGSGIGCVDWTFTILPKPTVSATPAGPISICSPATQLLTASTNAATPTYKWLNNNVAITGATASTFTATVTGSYRVAVIDGVTGCTDSSVAVIVTIGIAPVISIIPANATISCDSAKLSVNIAGLSSIKITEVTLFRTGTGATSPYPAYIGASDADFLEISNVSGSPINVAGYSINDYADASATSVHPYSLPSGTIIPANSVLVIHLGPGTDDAANRYFNTGGSIDSYFSSSQVGFVLKDNTGTIIDVVGCGGSASGSYTFAAGTGVSASDWTGFAPNASVFAGVYRSGTADTNAGADWTQSNSPTPLQTIGTYNSVAYVIPTSTASWSPITGLFTDALLTTPYISGNVSVVYAKPTTLGNNIYTATASNGGCAATASATVTVLPAGTSIWTGAISTDWANIGNWNCAGIPTTTSEVVIPNAVPNYPVINLNVEIKKLTVNTGATVTTATGFTLTLNGN